MTTRNIVQADDREVHAEGSGASDHASTPARSLNSYQLFWKDSTQKELLLVGVFWGVFISDHMAKIWQKIDDDLEHWIPAKRQLEKKKPPKAKTEVKQMSAKKKMRTEFAMIQKLYRKCKSRAINKVLTGEYTITTQKGPGLKHLYYHFGGKCSKRSRKQMKEPQPSNTRQSWSWRPLSQERS